MEKARKKDQNSFIMVVDEEGSQVMDSFIKFSELIENGYSGILKLNNARTPLPKFSAVYVLKDFKNIKAVIKDFTINQKYKYCHIFFLEEPNKNLIETLKKSEIIKFIKNI